MAIHVPPPTVVDHAAMWPKLAEVLELCGHTNLPEKQMLEVRFEWDTVTVRYIVGDTEVTLRNRIEFR